MYIIKNTGRKGIMRAETDVEKKIAFGLNLKVRNNIKNLMDYKGMNGNQLINALGEKEGHCITVSYLNRLLNHPDSTKMPLIFIMQCANYFNVSIDDLLSDDIDLQEIGKEQNIRKFIPDTQTLIDAYDHNYEENKQLSDSKLNDASEKYTSALIADPNNILFQSVLQTYHCYFYPTASRENHSDKSLLHATLEFYNENDECKAVFTVEANKRDKNKQPIKKKYIGHATYSTATNSLYCILKDDIEFCFIIFRYAHFSYVFQDCHMAEVLSTSSATTDRYPTALRMFLSKEKIKQEHLALIEPHLKVNYSYIAINSGELTMLEKEAPQYTVAINAIRQRISPKTVYGFKEKDAIAIAHDYLKNDDLVKFITLLRAHSEAFRYTKVGDRVSDNVRTLLKSLGYYREDF